MQGVSPRAVLPLEVLPLMLTGTNQESRTTRGCRMCSIQRFVSPLWFRWCCNSLVYFKHWYHLKYYGYVNVNLDYKALFLNVPVFELYTIIYQILGYFIGFFFFQFWVWNYELWEYFVSYFIAFIYDRLDKRGSEYKVLMFLMYKANVHVYM